MVFVAGRPGSHKPSATRAVKSCQIWPVVCIPRRRGCHGRIPDATILNTHRVIAEILCENVTKSKYYRILQERRRNCVKYAVIHVGITSDVNCTQTLNSSFRMLN